MAHDLVSLITVLQEDRVLDDRMKVLVESLLEKVTSLKSLLEKSVAAQHRSRGNNKEIIVELEREIRDAAHEAEDIIESHAVDQMMLSEPEATTRYVISPPHNSMSKVIEKFDAANYKLTNIIKLQSHDEGEAISNHSLSVAAYTNANSALMMVGFEEDALHLKHRLTSQTRAREIIPIVGMGGIGKTTLARNLYDDRLIVSHFDARAWVTVSQDYSVRSILLCLLGCLFGEISDHMLQQSDIELGLNLYQRLCGRRFLIVLDDVWNEKAWDDIKYCFPIESNGSRILITSRELHVAKHADSACEQHQMRLLSDAQSWDLLHHKVFEKDEHCPPPLEEIGRRIASNCGGLPLTISVIGGLLSVDRCSEDLWGRVAREVRSIASHASNHISKILCLSYDNLPLHLKPCFLYMSAFREDFEVRGSKLVKLWVAEGFLPTSNVENNKSLEDVAEEYLKALVDRNLLSIARTMYDGRAESYSMHDLLRDLCVRKADEEKFLRISKCGNANNFRRVSIHVLSNNVLDLAEDLSCSRSLLLIDPKFFSVDTSPTLPTLRLVRVLDVYDSYFDDFPVEILKMANLRFLAIDFGGSLPSAIWRLPNLQTLLVSMDGEHDVILPREAWEISCLRHIIAKCANIYIDFEIPRIHESLQTICSVCLHDLLASNLINNIPNTRKLKIYGDKFISEDRIIDLSHLHKLETLKLECFSVATLSLLELPICLKKLSFYRCTLPMGLVNGVGDLQFLEVLKIDSCGFQPEQHIEEEEEEEAWDLNEGVEFCSLQFLSLKFLRIKHWKADYSHFPRLRHLEIRSCSELEEIPACIGEISTLEMIKVNEYMDSHVAWANEVRETQLHEYGNESLRIHIVKAGITN